MVAIKVKYLPASNYKGSRLKAECGKLSITISYPDHTHHGDETFFEAVKALVENKVRQWLDVVWAVGYLEKTNEYVFTYICDVNTPLGKELTRRGPGRYCGFFVTSSNPEPAISAIQKAQGGAK